MGEKREPARGNLGLVRRLKKIKPVSGTYPLESLEIQNRRDTESKQVSEGQVVGAVRDKEPSEPTLA